MQMIEKIQIKKLKISKSHKQTINPKKTTNF